MYGAARHCGHTGIQKLKRQALRPQEVMSRMKKTKDNGMCYVCAAQHAEWLRARTLGSGSGFVAQVCQYNLGQVI